MESLFPWSARLSQEGIRQDYLNEIVCAGPLPRVFFFLFTFFSFRLSKKRSLASEPTEFPIPLFSPFPKPSPAFYLNLRNYFFLFEDS